MIKIETKNISTSEAYKLLLSSIIPRPIALVTTISANGKINLAAFSAYNLVSSNPPTVCFSIARKSDGSKKDTLRNLEDNAELVISSAHKIMLPTILVAGSEFEYEVSEIEAANIKTLPSEFVKPPRLADAKIHFECKLHTNIEIQYKNHTKDNSLIRPQTSSSSPSTNQAIESVSANLIVAEIICFHIDNALWQDQRIDYKNLDLVSRLGGISYAEIGKISDHKIPKPEDIK